MGTTQRLDKILSNSGYGTRKEAGQLIRSGNVTVDGVTVKDRGMHVDPESSVIEVCGERLKYRKFIYLMMNKPQGVISATTDNRHETAVDILPDEYRGFNLFPAGRLDIDTEGLLLMTNDGQLAHDLLSPKRNVPKTYYALVRGVVTREDVERFREGVTLDDGYRTLPAELEIIRQGSDSEVELTIYEGKFHQVKRMFEAVGKKVKYLKRLRIGNLVLDENLEPGECRELTMEELDMLKASVFTPSDS